MNFSISYFMSLQVSIIVPDRVFWKDEAEEVILPTLTGQMGILSNHIATLTGLDSGAMLIRMGSKWFAIALMGGFALIKENKVTILVNEAELSSDIDSDEAESFFLSAKSELELAAEGLNKVKAASRLKKAKARFETVQRIKSLV